MWGMGPLLFLLTLVGWVSVGSSGYMYLKNLKREWQYAIFKILKDYGTIIVFGVFYLFYFLVIGHSAVKFMRYMLPLYPFFAISAGYGMYSILSRWKQLSPALLVCLIGAVIWTLSFVSIYNAPHTRIAATDWIISHIPVGSTLAVEHWDDRVPIYDGDRYQYQEMTLYDLPDDLNKWQVLSTKLENSQYIILASNRLYVPLPKLADCAKFKKCYPLTQRYYQMLFDGTLGFRKVAEFAADPTIPLTGIHFSDQSADESFTVYDHPKIMVFQKERDVDISSFLRME
jgi:hypothetical protein